MVNLLATAAWRQYSNELTQTVILCERNNLMQKMSDLICFLSILTSFVKQALPGTVYIKSHTYSKPVCKRPTSIKPLLLLATS